MTSSITSAGRPERFNVSASVMLAPLPLLTAALLFGLYRLLARMPLPNDAWHHLPFWGATGLFVLFFAGLAWSFFPYVVPERLTIWESASAPESLSIILAGAAFVLPVIVLTEIGVIVGLGVLLDSLLVRTVLVPALVHLIGDPFWAPSRLSRPAGPLEEPTIDGVRPRRALIEPTLYTDCMKHVTTSLELDHII